MDRALRLGIVGMGGQGSRYTRFAEANPHARVAVVAFMEAVPAIRDQKMADHGLPGYATVEEMLDKTELDAVLVATPDFAHREPTLAAAERGKHLLIEKPFATTLDDALVMYDAIKRAGVKAQICFQNRFHPAFTLAKRAVDGGDIGDVLFINARQNCGGVAEWVAAGQRWYNHTDVAWSQLSHLIDVASWITGKRGQRIYATRVRKHLVSQGITTDDVIHASVLHDDGTDAIYEGAWCMPDQYPIGMDFRVDVVGTRGAVQANTSDQGIAVTRPTGYRLGSLNEVSLLGDLRGAHLDMMAAFARAVLDDSEPTIPVEDGLESTRILVAIHRSIETGQAVEMASLAAAGSPAS